MGETREAAAAWFEVNGSKRFRGWTFGGEWNGYERPYFEKSEADRISLMNRQLRHGGVEVQTVRYHPVGDYFLMREPGAVRGGERVRGQTIQTTSGPRHVYAIGNGSWVWQMANRPKNLADSSMRE